jgi:hypothetical protein
MLWLVRYLPESLSLMITGGILLLGAAVTLLSWATKYLNNPYLHMHRLTIQVAGNLLLALGIYFHGGLRIEMEWRRQVQAAEAKIREYENQVPVINERVVTKYRTRVKVVDRASQGNLSHNEKNANAINGDCVLSEAAIESYNRAVTKTDKDTSP